MAIVKIAMPLKKFVGNENEIVVMKTKLFEVLKEIDKLYPQFISKICNSNGKVYPYLNIFINDRIVNDLCGVKVDEKDEVCIMPAVEY